MRSLGFERKREREESGPMLGHSRRRRAGAVGAWAEGGGGGAGGMISLVFRSVSLWGVDLGWE